MTENNKYTENDIGIKVIGKVINSKIVEGLTKDGKRWANTETMLLCGSEIVRIVQRHKESSFKPKQVMPNEIVSVNLFSDYRDNGVLLLNGIIE